MRGKCIYQLAGYYVLIKESRFFPLILTNTVIEKAPDKDVDGGTTNVTVRTFRVRAHNLQNTQGRGIKCSLLLLLHLIELQYLTLVYY